MTTGIYALTWPNALKIYVGQSKDVQNRYLQHCTSLRSGTSSRKLQEYTELEGNLPNLVILEEVPDYLNLDIFEQKYIDLFDSINNGLNTNKVYLKPAAATTDSKTLTLSCILQKLDKLYFDSRNVQYMWAYLSTIACKLRRNTLITEFNNGTIYKCFNPKPKKLKRPKIIGNSFISTMLRARPSSTYEPACTDVIH